MSNSRHSWSMKGLFVQRLHEGEGDFMNWDRFTLLMGVTLEFTSWLHFFQHIYHLYKATLPNETLYKDLSLTGNLLSLALYFRFWVYCCWPKAACPSHKHMGWWVRQFSVIHLITCYHLYVRAVNKVSKSNCTWTQAVHGPL